MRVTSIDFETANRNYESVCSVGIAVFEDQELVEAKSWLIKPHTRYLYFDPINVRINGITQEDVLASWEFDRVYQELVPAFKDSLVVAHNALFDMSVLKRVLRLYGLPCPEIDYLCTCKIARKTWPGLASYSLDSVCREFNYSFHHHDAKEDAIACGNLFHWAMEEHGVGSPQELSQKINLFPDNFTGNKNGQLKLFSNID